MTDPDSDPNAETVAFSSNQQTPSTGEGEATIAYVPDRDSISPPTEKELFLEAVEIENIAERDTFLENACGGDKALRQRIEDLLNVEEQTQFLEPGESVEALKDEVIPETHDTGSHPTTDNYEVGPEIARGGMGSIRVAEDHKLKRSVAIKVMHGDVAVTSSAHARFLLEAEVLAQLAHPNIVPIHDIVWEDGKPLFYSMKLVKGRTLQDVINELREEVPDTLEEYTLDRLLLIFRKVCDAISFAHSREIIHRDLKPENIMVGEFGEVLVMDWGLAKKLGEAPIREIDESINPEQENLTDTLQGDVMGTPQYMSPEQADGDIAALDQRSDIFSLGGILYAILTLRPPVEGTTLQEVLEKVKTAKIEAPSQLTTIHGKHKSGEQSADVLEAKQIKPLPHTPGGRVPPALSSVVMKALRRKKRDRYSSVHEFSADVEAFQGGFATSAENINFLGQLALLVRRHKGIAVATVASLILIVGLSAGFMFKVNAEKRAAIQAEQHAVKKEAETRGALARSALSLAEAAMRERNGLLMQSALENVPEDLREGEWRYLLDQSDSSIGTIDTGGGRIMSAAPDPQRPGVFAFADESKTVTLMNVQTGARLLQFTHTSSWNSCLTFSSDGQQIAIGSSRNSDIVIHSAVDGRKLTAWEAPASERLEFSHDGTTLLQTWRKGSKNSRGVTQITLWNTATGKMLWERDGFVRRAWAEFTIDGTHIVMCDEYNDLLLLSPADGSTVRSLGMQVLSVATMNPNGKSVIVSMHDGSLQAVDLKSGEIRFRIVPQVDRIRHLAFQPDGRRFVSVIELQDGRQEIQIWDAATGALKRSILGGVGPARNVCIHPQSGELIITGDSSRVWDCGSESWTLGGLQYTVGGFWGSDDLYIGQGKKDFFVLQELKAKGKVTELWKPDLDLAKDKGTVISMSVAGAFAVITEYGKYPTSGALFTNRGGEIRLVRKFDFPVNAKNLRMNPNGSSFFVCNSNSSIHDIRIFDISSGSFLDTTDKRGGEVVNDACWLKNGREILGLATFDATRGNPASQEKLVVWDAVSGKLIRSSSHPTAMDVLALAPDGLRFAEGGEDRKIRIRDVATLEILQEFRTHDKPITSVAWHPTRPILATGSEDLTIRLWNLESGKRVEELHGADSAPTYLAFSPSGTRLAGSEYLKTRIWSLEVDHTADVSLPSLPSVSSPTSPTPPKPVITSTPAPEQVAGEIKSGDCISSATKAKPYENSLGMRFVPVAITGGPSDGKTVLFSIWETRVKDYEAFIKENKGLEWPKVEWKQKDDHPAANVSWDDAVAFCAWLTELDRKKGKLGKDELYRLPTDHEWSCAIGLGREEDAGLLPSVKNAEITDIYPWGDMYPPPKEAGNYYGEECERNPETNRFNNKNRKLIKGYNDGFDRTSPVGSFKADENGLYDMGGNVLEWCEDMTSTEERTRVLRGASWAGDDTRSYLWSSRRLFASAGDRRTNFGVRLVVAVDSDEKPIPKPASITQKVTPIGSKGKASRTADASIDLLAAVDIERDSKGELEWEKNASGLSGTPASPSARNGHVVPPVPVSGDYELELRFLPEKGSLAVTFPVGASAATFFPIHGPQDSTYGAIEKIDGMSLEDKSNPTRFQPSPFRKGIEETVLLRVREQTGGNWSIEVIHDDKTLTSWTGDPARLTTISVWNDGTSGRIGLGIAHGGGSTYLSAMLYKLESDKPSTTPAAPSSSSKPADTPPEC